MSKVIQWNPKSYCNFGYKIVMLCYVMVILCYTSNINYVQPTFRFELELSGIDNILIFKKISPISHIRKNRNF